MSATKSYSASFPAFKARFSAICEAHGGVFSQADSFGEGATYLIPTCWGPLRASIHKEEWRNRRGGSYIKGAYLQWQKSDGGYTGPAKFPFYGDFNPWCHKWNIVISADTWRSAQDAVLCELEWRLDQLKEQAAKQTAPLAPVSVPDCHSVPCHSEPLCP